MRLQTTAVMLAAGMSYRRLDIASLDALNGSGVYYGSSTSEAPALEGRDVYIAGGANSSGQAVEPWK